MPIFARLHHVTGVINGQTHVVHNAETHIMHAHEVRFQLADGTVKKYSLRSGHPPVEILPEHREYFANLRDREAEGPLACEVYEAASARPVPEAPSKRHGAITASDLNGLSERAANAEARAAEAEARTAGLEANVNRLAGMMETLLARQPVPAGTGTPPAAPAAPSAPPAASPPVPLTRDGIPAAFPADPVAPAPAVPAAKEPDLTQTQQHREPPQKPESDAVVMARTAHETATRAGFRDKRPKVSP